MKRVALLVIAISALASNGAFANAELAKEKNKFRASIDRKSFIKGIKEIAEQRKSINENKSPRNSLKNKLMGIEVIAEQRERQYIIDNNQVFNYI